MDTSDWKEEMIRGEALGIAEAKFGLEPQDLGAFATKFSMTIQTEGEIHRIYYISSEGQSLCVNLTNSLEDEETPVAGRTIKVHTNIDFLRLIKEEFKNIRIQETETNEELTFPEDYVITQTGTNRITVQRSDITPEEIKAEKIENPEVPFPTIPDDKIIDREAIDYANEKANND